MREDNFVKNSQPVQSQTNNNDKENFKNSQADSEENSFNDKEAFKILATKFNDAVEVILELTNRVEKLETLYRLKSMESHQPKLKTDRYKQKNYGIKYIFIVVAIFAIIYLFYFNNDGISVLRDIKNDLLKILKITQY